jgi:hypothetical protein
MSKPFVIFFLGLGIVSILIAFGFLANDDMNQSLPIDSTIVHYKIQAPHCGVYVSYFSPDSELLETFIAYDCHFVIRWQKQQKDDIRICHHESNGEEFMGPCTYHVQVLAIYIILVSIILFMYASLVFDQTRVERPMHPMHPQDYLQHPTIELQNILVDNGHISIGCSGYHTVVVINP